MVYVDLVLQQMKSLRRKKMEMFTFMSTTYVLKLKIKIVNVDLLT